MDQQNPFEAPETFLTSQQVADMLQVSIKTLESWRNSQIRSLPFCRQGRFVRYRLSDVLDYMNSIVCPVEKPQGIQPDD